MDVFEGVRVALDGIRAHKLRSFLTMLGIIVGVAAVITMLALGEGARRQIQANITSLGTNLLYVRPGSASRGHVRYGLGTVQSLTEDDAVAIMAECPSVAAVTPESKGNAQVKYRNQNWSTYVVATTPDFADVNTIPIESGGVFDAGAVTWPVLPAGDFDCDADVDGDDFAFFAGCLSGPDVPVSVSCEYAGQDVDGDVDLADFAVFQGAFTGR